MNEPKADRAIYVRVTPSVYAEVAKLAKVERRSMGAQAAVMLARQLEDERVEAAA